MAKKNKQRGNSSSTQFDASEGERAYVSDDNSWRWNQPAYPVPVPEPMNMDEIAALTDEDLNAKSQVLYADRNRVSDRGMDTKLWDVELAYVHREFQLRRSRRDAHERFVREQARQFAEEEARLPSAEFDNLRYVTVS